tara:strand:- start:1414 stop:2073 length:660 start_codon:yes stop_codon:yes gene_type:complete
MSTPKYFRNYPDIQYALSANKAGIAKHISIKDYFNLLVLRDDIYKEETLYSPYTVHNGQRPDQVSYDVYGDEQFYWIVLQVNGITDYYTQWALSESELTEFVYEKYGGSPGAGKIHHWETVATYDQSTEPNLMLPGQLTVPEDFIFYYPSTPGSNVTLSTTPISISNFEYERAINEKKSQITILDKKYVYDYDREVRKYAQNVVPSVSFIDISDVITES